MFATLLPSTGMFMECSAARKIHKIKRNKPFLKVTDFHTSDWKMIFKTKVDAIAEEASKYVSAIKELPEKILGSTESFEKGNQCYRKVPKEIQQLIFPDLGASYQYNIWKMLSIFADM